MIGTTRLELAMALRRPTTWIALALLVVGPSGLRRVDWNGVARVSADPVSFYFGAAQPLLVIAALLVGAPLLSRARQRRLDPIWTRGPSAARLVAAAWLAGALVAVAGLLVSLALFLALAGVVPADAVVAAAAKVLALYAPAVLLAVTMALMLGMLVGETLAAAVMIVIVAFTAIVLPQSPLFGWTWLGGGTFYHAWLGFGPDAGLVNIRASLYIALALSLAMFASWLFGMTDRRSAQTRRATLLLVPAILLPTFPGVMFAGEAQARSQIASWPLVERGASVRTRGLEVDLDCAAGSMRGVSTMEVVDAPGPVVLGLNAGLRVSQVEPPGVSWTQDASGAIALRDAPAGTVVTITYHGSLRHRRDDYQRTMPGVLRIRVISLPVRAYLSRELCMLLRGGDWYPRALGQAEGPDGAQIPELRYRIAGDQRVIEPPGAPAAGTLIAPPACALVAIAPPATAGRPPEWDRTDEEQWERLRDGLRRLDQYPDAVGTWLPLIGGDGFGQVELLDSTAGICLPDRGLPASAGPTDQQAVLSARLMAEHAAAIAIGRQILVEPRPAVRYADGSSQDQGPRAIPGSARDPLAMHEDYLAVLRSSLADTLDVAPDRLLDLRRAALSSGPDAGQLLSRGVLPTGNAAVLGVHEYRRLSGDVSLTRLLGLLAAQAPGRVPNINDLRNVVAVLPTDQQRALAPLLDIR